MVAVRASLPMTCLLPSLVARMKAQRAVIRGFAAPGVRFAPSKLPEIWKNLFDETVAFSPLREEDINGATL